MQPPVAQTNLLARRRIALLVVICLCLTPLFLPFFTVLHAQESEAPFLSNDADGDRIVNTADIDDDNDGIPDALEITAAGLDRDSDRDGMPDRLDLDSDNDGILDWQESGATKTIDLSALRSVGGRLVGVVGVNGMLDVFESPLDTGNLAYTISNTDVNEDEIPDFLDLDSDNDGWPDILEAGVTPAFDANGDGRIDAPPGTVGNDGIADFLQQINDRACCDIDGDGVDDIIPINTDMTDLPDFQDLDSDNDGLLDIEELGGIDTDNDGHVDNFVDTLGGPDGVDDGLLAFPYQPRDQNANGVFDHIEFVSSVASENPVVPDPESSQPQPDSVDDPSVVPDPESSQPQPDSLDDPSAGVVLTGLSASGCHIGTAGDSTFLLLLILISLATLLWRSLMRKV